MGDAGCEQSDARKFVGLHQAPLQLVAIRDVVENNQPADLPHVFGHQRRNREIQDVHRGAGRLAVPFTVAVGMPVSAAVRNGSAECTPNFRAS